MRNPAVFLAAAGLVAAGLFVARTPGFAQDAVVHAPAPRLTIPVSADRETAIFAGGCFWGVQGVMEHVDGVLSTTAGYTGGKADTAEYETVSTGTTGHAESVKVVFDPHKVSYATLLRVYFSVITDPTEGNRQGPDEGPQYRSALFPQTPAQAKVAHAYLAQLSAAHLWHKPLTTTLEKDPQGFFPAEGYHQHFLDSHPHYPYIVINDMPKVQALKQMYPNLYRA